MFMQTCYESFINLDMFGERVEFTFKNNTQFKTGIGASVSTLMCLFFTTFMMQRTLKLVNSDDP